MNRYSSFYISLLVVVAVVWGGVPNSFGAVPADHPVHNIIANNAPAEAGRLIIDQYVVPAMETNGREVARVFQASEFAPYPGGGKSVEKRFQREETFSAGYSKVVVTYRDGRVYADEIRDGVRRQEIKRDRDADWRRISADGRIQDTAYSMADLTNRPSEYASCRPAFADNLIELRCESGPYPGAVFSLDLVSGSFTVVKTVLLDDGGLPWKTETRTNFQVINGKIRPSLIRLEDYKNLVKTYTTLEWEVNDTNETEEDQTGF